MSDYSKEELDKMMETTDETMKFFEEIQEKFNNGIKITDLELEKVSKFTKTPLEEVLLLLEEEKQIAIKDKRLEVIEPMQELFDTGKTISEKELSAMAKSVDITVEELKILLEEGKKNYIEGQKHLQEYEAKGEKYQAMMEGSVDVTDEELKEICDFFPHLDFDEQKAEMEAMKVKLEKSRIAAEERKNESILKKIFRFIKSLF